MRKILLKSFTFLKDCFFSIVSFVYSSLYSQTFTEWKDPMQNSIKQASDAYFPFLLMKAKNWHRKGKKNLQIISCH